MMWWVSKELEIIGNEALVIQLLPTFERKYLEAELVLILNMSKVFQNIFCGI